MITNKITILFLAANPSDSTRLRLDKELREIQKGLERSQNKKQIELISKGAVQPIDIQRAMLDHKPDIVHFSGHGDGEEGLLLENNQGKAQLVSTQALVSLFKLFADTTQCVLLNACYSEVQAKAIATYVPNVIGMNKAIGDKAAITFAVGFYDAIGAGQPLKFAYESGKTTLLLEGIAEDQTPVLIAQNTVDPAITHPSNHSTTESPGQRTFEIPTTPTPSSITTDSNNNATL